MIQNLTSRRNTRGQTRQELLLIVLVCAIALIGMIAAFMR